VSPTERETEADGGFSFEAQESQVEVTRGERLRTLWEEFVYKPGLVAWDDRRTRIGAIVLFIYGLIATVGVWAYPEPAKNQGPRFLQPFQNMDYPLGTTPAGTDVLSQAIHATPTMLIMVGSGALFATAVAVLIGTVAGYKGGRVDSIITTFSDIAMSIPGLPIVMVVAFIYQPENPLIIGPIIMINYWAGLGRSLRSQVLTLREEPYVEASRTMGVSTLKILYKDIIPNLMPFILVNFAFAARYVVFASVGLYYLGVLPAGLANWGLQLDRAYNTYSAMVGTGATYLIFVPMIFIGVLALGLVLFAQGLDRVFNPRVRTRLAGESESSPEDDDEGVVGVGV
jgi:peptide/nickel transport system permease protein